MTVLQSAFLLFAKMVLLWSRTRMKYSCLALALLVSLNVLPAQAGPEPVGEQKYSILQFPERPFVPWLSALGERLRKAITADDMNVFTAKLADGEAASFRCFIKPAGDFDGFEPANGNKDQDVRQTALALLRRLGPLNDVPLNPYKRDVVFVFTRKGDSVIVRSYLSRISRAKIGELGISGNLR